MIDYNQYRIDLKTVFDLYKKLDVLETAANDYTCELDEIQKVRDKYLALDKYIDDMCNGEYKSYPVKHSDGTHCIETIKVKDGCYEYLKPYTDRKLYPNYTAAMLQLRHDYNITEEDLSLCCSQEQYKKECEFVDKLTQKINKYQSRLKIAKNRIKDYELVHGKINQ